LDALFPLTPTLSLGGPGGEGESSPGLIAAKDLLFISKSFTSNITYL